MCSGAGTMQLVGTKSPTRLSGRIGRLSYDVTHRRARAASVRSIGIVAAALRTSACQLTSLGLESNEVDVEGAQALAAALHSPGC